MGIAWRDSAEELAGLLRRHGLDPDRVDTVETAWQAFCAFLAQSVEGLEPGPDSDADGFIVQWGRYSWHDGLPSLSFTRQLAVDVRDSWTETDWYQPEYWQVSLDLVFADTPALADLDQLEAHSTGFDFSPPGPERDRAVSAAAEEIQRHGALRELWASRPVRSTITLDCAD